MLERIKSHFIDWAIILGLCVVVIMFIVNTLKTQDLTLIDKDAKERVEWCENNADGCGICAQTSANIAK